MVTDRPLIGHISKYFHCYPLEDPVNEARRLMQMPVEAVLEESASDSDHVPLPASKKPKTAGLVQGAVLGQPMVEVPSQQVHLSLFKKFFSEFGIEPKRGNFVD